MLRRAAQRRAGRGEQPRGGCGGWRAGGADGDSEAARAARHGCGAGLLGADLGFDAVFFGHADYQDMGERQEKQQLEMVWRGTGGGPSCAEAAPEEEERKGAAPGRGSTPSSPTSSSEIFTGNFASGNYGPPAGFWWEWGSSPDPPIADDPALAEYNVEERVELFVQRCRELVNVTRGRDIMLTMGSDFTYSNAHVW